MIRALIISLALQLTQGSSLEPIVHWSMDLSNDRQLLPDYGDPRLYTVSLPWYRGDKYFTDGVIGKALSLNSQKVNLIRDIQEVGFLHNPITHPDGFTIAFWLYLKQLTRRSYQVILRSTNFDSRGPGIYIGGDEEAAMMMFLFRTADGIRYTLKIPWSPVKMNWCHFAVSWNLTFGIKVSLNGTSVSAEQNVTHGDESIASRKTLSAGDILGPRFLLDDVWLYNNSLVEETINEIYELGLTSDHIRQGTEVGSHNQFTPTQVVKSNIPNGITETSSESQFRSPTYISEMSANFYVANGTQQSRAIRIYTSSKLIQSTTTISARTSTTGTTTSTIGTTLRTMVHRVITAGRTTPPMTPTRFYTGWFYHQTWYHAFLGMTVFVIAAVSLWLCVTNCCVSPQSKVPVLGGNLEAHADPLLSKA